MPTLNQRCEELTDESSLKELAFLLRLLTQSLNDVNRIDLAIKKYADEERLRQQKNLSELKAEGVKAGINAEFLAQMDKYLGLHPQGANEN